VGDEDVGAGPGHVRGLLLVEHVRRSEQVHLMREADHVDLEAVAHAGLLEVGAEHAVDEADGGEVLDSGEADVLHLLEEVGHHSERVGAVDAG